METNRPSESSSLSGEQLSPFKQDGDASCSVDIVTPEPEPEVKPIAEAASNTNEKSESKVSTFSFKALPATKKWTMLAMAFANFAAYACFSLLAPFFPGEANKKGATQTAVGLIFSTFQLCIFVSSPVYGNFITRIGSRFMFVAGMFICGSCAILFGLLDKSPGGTVFVVMCFLVRSVEALGASAFITASFAIIANEFPNHVSTVFGVLETFTGVGALVGPTIGGALYELGGYGLPFWVMGVLLILCAALILIILPAQEDRPRPDQGSLLNLLTSPLVLVTTVPILSGAFAIGLLDPNLANHLEQFHLSTGVVGLMFIIISGVYGVTAPLWGYINDTQGISYQMLAAGNVVALVSFLLIGPSPLLPFLPHELWLVVVSLALVGLGVGCCFVCTIKCLVIGAKQIGFEDNLDTFGLISGLNSSVFSLGMFIGPTVGSILVEYIGFDWTSTITAAIFAFALVVFCTYLLTVKVCERCRTSSGRDGDSPPSKSLLGGLGSNPSVKYKSLDSTTVIVSSKDTLASENV